MINHYITRDGERVKEIRYLNSLIPCVVKEGKVFYYYGGPLARNGIMPIFHSPIYNLDYVQKEIPVTVPSTPNVEEGYEALYIGLIYDQDYRDTPILMYKDGNIFEITYDSINNKVVISLTVGTSYRVFYKEYTTEQFYVRFSNGLDIWMYRYGDHIRMSLGSHTSVAYSAVYSEEITGLEYVPGFNYIYHKNSNVPLDERGKIISVYYNGN